MKHSIFRYFQLFIIAIFIFACNGNTKNSADEANPVFQNDPILKAISLEIKNDPTNAHLYFERATKLYRLKQDSLAYRDYKKAAAIDTNNAEYLSAVGDFLFEKKDITGSIEWIKKAMAKNPTDRKSHLKIAKMMLYIKKYNESLKEIDIVLRKNPFDGEAYFLKGMVYKDMKDTAKAISSFQTSVDVQPDYKDAIVQLGLLYNAKKDPKGFLYLDNAAKLDTTDVFPIYAKGVYFQEGNDFEHAKEEYKKCIMHDSRYVNALFNLGFIFMQQDSVEKAMRQYDIVTKIDPVNAPAFFNRGICKESLDSIPQAIADYKQALRLNPDYPNPKDALKRLKVIK